MAESITVFENSLRDYLLNMQIDAYATQNRIQYKYNNLKVYMEPKRSQTPHFWVSVGISHACFELNNIDKISGSLGNDDKLVIRWANRPNIKGELEKHWAYISQANVLSTGKVQNEDEVKETMEISNQELKQAAEIIAGGGMRRKFVAFEQNMRKRNRAKNAKRASR